MATLRQLLEDYTSAMHEGDAALFIGAGLSTSAGLPDWKGLLARCAEALELDIAQENDFIALAQYYVNRRGRFELNRLLTKEFDKPRDITESHNIIAGFPISTIWTTNFDLLIEKALRAANKSFDIRRTDADFGKCKKGDVMLYKMHGDIDRPQEAIVSASDYEKYEQTHPIFQSALEEDLITKTFLFLGFSFTDPNLNYMLAGLRSVLGENKRVHYAIMRTVRVDWFSCDPKALVKWVYETTKQRLHLEDLRIRFGIHTLLVDKYDHVPEVLDALKAKNRNETVFVTGNAGPYRLVPESLKALCRRLGARLMENEMKLVADFRTDIGRALLEGALQELMKNEESARRKYLLRPLPGKMSGVDGDNDFDRACRDKMACDAGLAIFVGGSADDVELWHDFEVAKKQKAVLIPIGASGPGSERIWDLMRTFPGSLDNVTSTEAFDLLNDKTLDEEELVDAVFKLVDSIANRVPEIGREDSPMPSYEFCQQFMKAHQDWSPDMMRRIVLAAWESQKSQGAT